MKNPQGAVTATTPMPTTPHSRATSTSCVRQPSRDFLGVATVVIREVVYRSTTGRFPSKMDRQPMFEGAPFFDAGGPAQSSHVRTLNQRRCQNAAPFFSLATSAPLCGKSTLVPAPFVEPKELIVERRRPRLRNPCGTSAFFSATSAPSAVKMFYATSARSDRAPLCASTALLSLISVSFANMNAATASSRSRTATSKKCPVVTSATAMHTSHADAT